MAELRPVAIRDVGGVNKITRFRDGDILLLPGGFVGAPGGTPVEADDIVLVSGFFEGAAGSETLDDGRLPVGPVTWAAGDDVTVNVGLGTFHIGGAFSTSGAVSLSSTLAVGGASTLTGDVTGGPASTSAWRILRGRTDANVIIQAGADTSTGAGIQMFGSTHASAANVLQFRSGNSQIGGFYSGVLILGPGSAAGSATAGGIRATGASQFDAAVTVSSSLTASQVISPIFGSGGSSTPVEFRQGGSVRGSITSTGALEWTGNVSVTSASAVIAALVRRDIATGSVMVSGGSSSSNGGRIELFGGSHGSNANQIHIIGNAGIGTTAIQAFHSNHAVLRNGFISALLARKSGAGVVWAANAYWDSDPGASTFVTTGKYISGAIPASAIEMTSTGIRLAVAPTGTVDTAIPWSTVIHIDYSGAPRISFYPGTTPVAKQTGVPVTDAGIHAALVNLGLIAA